MEHLLEARKLYILSGLPGSGKSTLMKQIPDEMVISADKLREQMFGVKREIRNGKEREYLFGWDKNPDIFFSIINEMVTERAREQLTTFLDATNLNDNDRKEYFEIARKFGMDAEVLILDVDYDVLLQRNEDRLRYVQPDTIKLMSDLFVKKSEFPHRIIQDGDTLALTPDKLEPGLYDVVGDVHGLYDELVQLLTKSGYTFTANGVPVHPQGRKLIFLGDVVDRGRKSIEMLQFVEKAVNQGKHVFIPGNHEDKLVKIWDLMMNQNILQPRSKSGAETLNALLKLDEAEQSKLMTFVKRQKAYRLIDLEGMEFALGHADVTSFNPYTTLKSVLLYGDSGHGARDSDQDYELGVEANINRYRYIRGHIKQTSEQEHVRSLEFDQAYEGHLALLNLNEYAADIKAGLGEPVAFKNHVHFQKCDFNYNSVVKDQFAVVNELSALQKDKLVFASVEPKTGLSLFKYDKQVFFKGLWDVHPLLLKTRGLVLDVAGNVVQHPFDKIFNYGERGTGLDVPDATVVECIEKLNGFLGCITKHPYKNDLLITTTGSFDSPYVEYIKSFITPEKRGRLLKHFAYNDETLMFEVIHPEDDEHPVQYGVEDQGLWLIGARGKNFDDKIKSEDYLDDLGMTLGLKRPARYRTTLGQVREWAKTSELEGFIVRLGDGSGDPITKLKTVHYLTTKFLGRLSVNNIKFMYNSPEKFKLKLDEEYQEMVDVVVKSIPMNDFMQFTNMQKMELMRDFIQKMRAEGEQNAQHPDSILNDSLGI